jgi:hypothetical protein
MMDLSEQKLIGLLEPLDNNGFDFEENAETFSEDFSFSLPINVNSLLN